MDSYIKLFLGISALLAVNAFGSFSVPDGGITTAKLAAQSVTQVKLGARTTGTTVGAGGVAISASSNGYSVTSSQTQVTNLSVTITTTGRPVALMMIPDGTASAAQLSIVSGTSSQAASGIVDVQYRRGATTLVDFSYGANIPGTSGGFSNSIVPMPGTYIDVVAAGTYTYHVFAALSSGNTTAGSIVNVKLLAYEL